MTGATLTFLAFDANTSVSCFWEMKEDIRLQMHFWQPGLVNEKPVKIAKFRDHLFIRLRGTLYPHSFLSDRERSHLHIVFLFSWGRHPPDHTTDRSLSRLPCSIHPPFNQVLETFQTDGSPSELELNPLFHMIWLPRGLFLQFCHVSS